VVTTDGSPADGLDKSVGEEKKRRPAPDVYTAISSKKMKTAVSPQVEPNPSSDDKEKEYTYTAFERDPSGRGKYIKVHWEDGTSTIVPRENFKENECGYFFWQVDKAMSPGKVYLPKKEIIEYMGLIFKYKKIKGNSQRDKKLLVYWSTGEQSEEKRKSVEKYDDLIKFYNLKEWDDISKKDFTDYVGGSTHSKNFNANSSSVVNPNPNPDNYCVKNSLELLLDRKFECLKDKPIISFKDAARLLRKKKMRCLTAKARKTTDLFQD